MYLEYLKGRQLSFCVPLLLEAIYSFFCLFVCFPRCQKGKYFLVPNINGIWVMIRKPRVDEKMQKFLC